LRCVVEVRSRRTLKARIHAELLKLFQEGPGIKVASVTVAIVGFPPLKSDKLSL
jgi:hypothetical protein